MSKFLKGLLVFVVVTTAIGCGNQSENADGTCTAEFVADYNRAATGSASGCNTFFSKHDGVTCDAQNLSTGTRTSASANDLRTLCGR